ncbi:hydantoinase [Acinetobacter baumannii]|uniref:hydantoinase/oxoprolinase family protein n=1 Tax=Acinetobacter baumannii TaxID=470 RepID=UPI000925FDA3|nr:hydantoinase/oxoprolinase family protein [Acinetobacter baumannii]OJK06334.1 hydantoinase [Acinetobacter baumannii]
MTLQINIDNGGTLTDICIFHGNDLKKTKVMTTPYDLSKCFFEGLKKASTVLYGQSDVAKLLEEVDLIRYSTTQGTNAICERKGPKLGLITDAKGELFVSELQEQDSDIFNALVADRVVFLHKNESDQEAYELEIVKAVNVLTAAGANRVVISLNDANFEMREDFIKKVVLRRYPRHLLGAVPVLYGCDLSKDEHAVRRTWSALINSFLHPSMEHFLFNAENRLREFKTKNPLLIFRNDGDASRVAKTIAIKTYSSGPRGGMEGMKTFARTYDLPDVVAIDIGGTTTDIAQSLDYQVREIRRGRVEGIDVSFPLTAIHSAGAGGSSVFKVVDDVIQIGPESVGAVPGPAAFGRGGKLATITDASLLSGLFDPVSYFGGGLNLDLSRAKSVVETEIAQPLGLAVDQALLAMEDAYQAKIAKEIHRFTAVSENTILLAFGGAGPLNACGIAEQAGIKQVTIPGMAAVFSAYGIGSCDISQRYTASLAKGKRSVIDIENLLANLNVNANRDMFAEGFSPEQYDLETQLVLSKSEQEQTVVFQHAAEITQDLDVYDVVELEVNAIKHLRQNDAKRLNFAKQQPASSALTRNILTQSQGRIDVPVYKLADLQTGDYATGPAILEEDFFTCRVRDGWTFVISAQKDILLSQEG